jgi:hypothetical protein
MERPERREDSKKWFSIKKIPAKSFIYRETNTEFFPVQIYLRQKKNEINAFKHCHIVDDNHDDDDDDDAGDEYGADVDGDEHIDDN